MSALDEATDLPRSPVTVSFPRGRRLSTRIPVETLSPAVKAYVDESAKLCRPKAIHVCTGSEAENDEMLKDLMDHDRLTKLDKYDNCYLAITEPKDVARVEKQTYVCTAKREDAVATPKPGIVSKLGNWRDPAEMDAELHKKFSGSMEGRTMYVIPFSMGPVDSPLSKIGIQLTDSEYVVASMRIMTRMGLAVLTKLKDGPFVKCLHSVGHPLQPGDTDVAWPCDTDNIAVVHFPERNEIKSYGSGYGGNSLLGKKCFALRIATTLAKREGWLAEHMLILGLTSPEGRKHYIAAAFPSQCGKTNLAMLTPTLPGWKAECVGDDIAWMKFDENGQLRAINPENGFFGVCPGTNMQSNPNAMDTIFKNTIFTNVAKTSDGGVYWEGLEKEVDPSVKITSWRGVENWQDLSPAEKKEHPAAHPNSRFCTPTKQCPIVDPLWEDPKGVPIDAILFGGRRPESIPLVYESFSWEHGVFVGAAMKSEGTAAATDTGKAILHDPFAMRPFFGYNVGQYIEHWLELEKKGYKLPKIFHVNWFRKDANGKFMWPGFGDNIRVIDWILKRCEGQDVAQKMPLGYVPKPGTINTEGLSNIDMDGLLTTSKEDLEKEVRELEKYFEQQLPDGQLPHSIAEQLKAFKERIAQHQ